MDDALRSKLGDLENALAETITQMGDPDLVSDQERFAAVGRRHAELKPVVDAYHQYQAAEEERADALERENNLRAFKRNPDKYTKQFMADYRKRACEFKKKLLKEAKRAARSSASAQERKDARRSVESIKRSMKGKC